MVASASPDELPIEVTRIDRTEDGGTTNYLEHRSGPSPLGRMVHEVKTVWSIREDEGQRVLRAARTERNAVTGEDGVLRWAIEGIGTGDQAYGPSEFRLPKPEDQSAWCGRNWIAVMTDGPSVKELAGDPRPSAQVDLTRWMRMYLDSLPFQGGKPAIREGHALAVLLDVTLLGGAQARWAVTFAGRFGHRDPLMPNHHTASFEGELVVDRVAALPARLALHGELESIQFSMGGGAVNTRLQAQVESTWTYTPVRDGS